MNKRLSILFILFGVAVQGQTITTIAGTGTAGYSGDHTSATTAQLNKPNTLAFDASGNAYVCDAINSRIRKISATGIISTIAGNGTALYSGDGGPATLASFYHPGGIAVDVFGNIFISSADQRIRKINPAGIITTIAGTGTFGYNGDNIPATDAQLSAPYVGTTDDAGNVYFGDYNNHRVRKISTTGIITTVAGNGTNTNGGDNGPATAAGVGTPCWVHRSVAGDIYIPDNSFNQLRKVSPSGVITTVAGTGSIGSTGDGGQATAATFMLLNNAVTDNAGNVYIADRGAYAVRKINSAGIITKVAGTGILGYSGDGAAATLAQLGLNTVTVDKLGNVYIADMENHRIRKITYNNTGINELNNAIQYINIYPNPATEQITIEAECEIEMLSISNTIGQSMYAQPAGKNKTTIDISHFASGLYFVKANGVYVGRFVKE
ncbi:MAG: hypothetical protein JWQ38_2894 [Flavipsychrobacter sp.]|nr:hypothetical protein [Flavipsychrobacter sp.]